jgi:hypothetical protein
MGAQMATIARFLARRIPASQAEGDVLKQLALFAFAGLLTAFLLASYGLDVSAGFSERKSLPDWPQAPRVGAVSFWLYDGARGSFIAGQRST